MHVCTHPKISLIHTETDTSEKEKVIGIEILRKGGHRNDGEVGGESGCEGRCALFFLPFFFKKIETGSH